LSRSLLFPIFLVAPLALAACGGGSSNGSAGVTPTATASIEIIGTPAPAAGTTSSSGSSSATAASAAPLTISASARTSTNTAVTSAATGAVYTVSGTGTAPLVLRQSPNGAKITDLPAGSKVTAVGDPTQQAAGYTWLHVKSAKGDTGWVATKYLSGGPAATPVPGGQQ
jgi:hypothetical protein